MNQDLDAILAAWPFDPSQINARLITSGDGHQKVQLRLDLGIIQMELDGRPDGQRPENFESWFAYYQDAFNRHTQSGADPEEFLLDNQACHRLQQEAIQYYHRYLSLFQLQDWHRVIRDTMRNIQVAEFMADYAESDEHAWSMLQFKPYMLMMHARAAAILQIENGHHIKALDTVRDAIEQIELFLEETEFDGPPEECTELQFLKDWLNELESTRPISPRERVERQLAQAISEEKYEVAAQLRDQLAKLG